MPPRRKTAEKSRKNGLRISLAARSNRGRVFSGQVPGDAMPTVGRRPFPRLWLGAVLPLVALLVLFAGLTPARAAAAQTVVSLEFDDATADQAPARSLLSSHNMQGTFF